MCRYILSQGGATTKVGDEIWYPLWAATNQGHLAVCQWLYKNGAKEDATAKTSVSISPLSLCWSLSNEKCWEIGEWFLANGAIHNDHSGEIDPSAWSELIRGGKQKQKRLLSCSQNVLKNRDTFQVFLMGTCVCPEFSLEALATKLETKLGSKNAAKLSRFGVDSGKAKLLWTQLLETRKKSPVAKISGQVEC
ncbi:expressed unknown protein [Seminavis robusta]|uniref:Uncharacterized protein n=1 Tax=Seminavis robusta TaxID=568900 RepID=A0A9N8HS24_9STRA|nr:expressed unknown protein [Seminavis robusta]|eukprot:Sro1659_g289180.1 n/a (193) ;mRNA; f:16-594